MSKKIVYFIIGACVGSAGTWYYVSNKYKKIAQEEIDSVKEVLLKRKKEDKDDTNQTIVVGVEKMSKEALDYLKKDAEISKKAYHNIVNAENYSTNKDGENDMNKHKKPYVVSPDEYDNPEYEHYEKTSLTYYADDVLVDESDEVLSRNDIEDLVGLSSLNSFGEYEDDSVFVRNDRLGIDFEILLDQSRFNKIETPPKREKKPHEVD